MFTPPAFRFFQAKSRRHKGFDSFPSHPTSRATAWQNALMFKTPLEKRNVISVSMRMYIPKQIHICHVYIYIIYLIISQALILHSPKNRNSACPSTWYLTNGEHYTHWGDGHSLLNQPKWCDQPKLHLPTFWLISRFTNQSTLSIT